MKQKPFRFCSPRARTYSIRLWPAFVMETNTKIRETTASTEKSEREKGREREAGKREEELIIAVPAASVESAAMIPSSFSQFYTKFSKKKSIRLATTRARCILLEQQHTQRELRKRNYLLFFRVYNKLIIRRRCCFGPAH